VTRRVEDYVALNREPPQECGGSLNTKVICL
jgi:hypothetical protein